MGSHSLLQGNLPRDWTQVSCIAGRFFYHLTHQGSPKAVLNSCNGIHPLILCSDEETGPLRFFLLSKGLVPWWIDSRMQMSTQVSHFYMSHLLYHAGIILEPITGLLFPFIGHCLMEKAWSGGSRGTESIQHCWSHTEFSLRATSITVPWSPLQLRNAQPQRLYWSALFIYVKAKWKLGCKILVLHCAQREHRLWSQQIWVKILVLPLANPGNMNKWLHITDHQAFYLKPALIIPKEYQGLFFRYQGLLIPISRTVIRNY